MQNENTAKTYLFKKTSVACQGRFEVPSKHFHYSRLAFNIIFS